ncbi:MAG: hypothetical protein AAGE92_16160, partial [Cyanobacteria bacterium P01_G01_bin.4]
LKNGVLVDTSFKNGTLDEEEEAANQFAAELLFGDMSLQWDSRLKYRQLLQESRRSSTMYRLDPGSVILNYAWQTGDWKHAMTALNRLEPHANAPATINSHYQHRIVRIDEESRDYLERAHVLC